MDQIHDVNIIKPILLCINPKIYIQACVGSIYLSQKKPNETRAIVPLISTSKIHDQTDEKILYFSHQ
jgi:hypothetical protein